MTSKPSSSQPRAAAISVRRWAEVTCVKEIVVAAMVQDEEASYPETKQKPTTEGTKKKSGGHEENVARVLRDGRTIFQKTTSETGNSAGCGRHLCQFAAAALRR